ncbi:GNAT family N-acetyltransferase [Amphritea sp. 2_MG-2023]|uniref:GNAT family N-acetyltransferase n=1 Tax=Amphritea TaxID=515417 RepID=UPI001C06BBCF|nr:GNAT family N-acetyltransferase [Amphritea sp. 2_MG-2023]MBU2966580.1 GNAT family N-acetyltransferase [Amphritea atlantica]MDO6417561.1 GNAT family N-acetyltransferase [Amphritea sp. 2_MG-2023]
MEIIEYSSGYAKDVADLFYSSVHAIDSSIYSEEQKNTWAQSPIDYVAWCRRLEKKRPYLLLISQQFSGFIELESDGHIDCVYVSPEFQRKGVAATLLKYVIVRTQKLELQQLYAEASIAAKSLFEKFGFVVKKENRIIRNEIVLCNYSMYIELTIQAA